MGEVIVGIPEGLTIEEKEWVNTRANSAIFEDPERGVCAYQAAATWHKRQDAMHIGDGIILVADGVTGVNGVEPNMFDDEEKVYRRTDHILVNKIASSYDINPESSFDILSNLDSGSFERFLNAVGPGAIASRALTESVVAVMDILRRDPNSLANIKNEEIVAAITVMFSQTMSRIFNTLDKIAVIRNLKKDFSYSDVPESHCVDFASNLACVMNIGEELIVISVGDTLINIVDNFGNKKELTDDQIKGSTDSFRAIAAFKKDGDGKVQFDYRMPKYAQIIRRKKDQIKSIEIATDGNKQRNESEDDISMVRIYDAGKFFSVD